MTLFEIVARLSGGVLFPLVVTGAVCLFSLTQTDKEGLWGQFCSWLLEHCIKFR